MNELKNTYSPVHIKTIHGIFDNQANMNQSHESFGAEVLILTTTTQQPNLSSVFCDGEIPPHDIEGVNVQDVIVWCMHNNKSLFDLIICERQKKSELIPNTTYRDANYTISLVSKNNDTLNSITLNTSMSDDTVVGSLKKLISEKKKDSTLSIECDNGVDLNLGESKKTISELIRNNPLALHKTLRSGNVGICISEAYDAYK